MLSKLATTALLAATEVYAQQAVTVVNGASFRPEIAGGSWATASGAFANVSNTTASASPIPKTLSGVTVTVGGVESPVYFVSATQINFLVPYAVQPGLRPVVVKTASATLEGSARVLKSAPGIFAQDAANPPKGAILNKNSSLNTQANPAQRGEVIQIYGTGAGQITGGTVFDGAPVSGLLSSTSLPQVFVGGAEAKVQFSGLTPGLAGIWQVNAFVPDNGFVKGRVPVVVFIDGIHSNEVGVFVQ
jgi:uncharacterized protein (TIGR03437 family)